MGWNHRVLATKEVHLNGESEMVFSIHEVYYDKNGIPDGYTKNPISISTDSVSGLKWTLARIKECLDKPVLWGDERFPEEYVPNTNDKQRL